MHNKNESFQISGILILVSKSTNVVSEILCERFSLRNAEGCHGNFRFSSKEIFFTIPLFNIKFKYCHSKIDLCDILGYIKCNGTFSSFNHTFLSGFVSKT